MQFYSGPLMHFLSGVDTRDLYSLAESAVEVIATAIATMHEASFEAVPISTSVQPS
jgi:hypothetical protein